jgi:hypothetical protein
MDCLAVSQDTYTEPLDILVAWPLEVNNMIMQMTECGRPLSTKEIEALDAKLGLSLPEEYKSFLLRYNGGRPTPNAYPIDGLENNPFGVIQGFFGVDDPIESCNLDWNVAIMKGRLPANLLPIACDDGDDLICISLFGEDAGAVVFWDQHAESSTPSYDNVYRIADSFMEFLDGIRELPSHQTDEGNG